MHGNPLELPPALVQSLVMPDLLSKVFRLNHRIKLP